MAALETPTDIVVEANMMDQARCLSMYLFRQRKIIMSRIPLQSAQHGNSQFRFHDPPMNIVFKSCCT